MSLHHERCVFHIIIEIDFSWQNPQPQNICEPEAEEISTL